MLEHKEANLKENKIYNTALYCRLSLDDGYSGLNFNRPGFGMMIQDIENGKVNLVITKDLSRFGRNYIETGYYTEHYFKDVGVRYIAINDGIDTINDNNDKVNIVHFYHLKTS